MANKKSKAVEVQKVIVSEEVQEQVPVEEVQVAKEDVVEEVVVIDDASASLDEPARIVAPPKPFVEEKKEDYSPKDIVEFENNRGELRYGQYEYITKRGYTALRKYTNKK